MRLFRFTHELTALVAVSYVTLGLFATSVAEHLWAPYSGTMLLLAAVNLREYRARR